MSSRNESPSGEASQLICDVGRSGYAYRCQLSRRHIGDHAFTSPTSGVVNTWPRDPLMQPDGQDPWSA